jgi:hypothetical protein
MNEKVTKLENGNYLLETIVDCHRRAPIKKQASKVENQQAKDTDNTENENTAEPEADTTGDSPVPSNVFMERWRLISADMLYPSMGWLGPQLVDYGANEAHALKQAVDIINTKTPPLCWNHTSDIQAVAGHIERAGWENSKDIKPGINGYLVVDHEYDPKAAKGLEKKILNAGSISLSFEMKPSHPEMDFDSFVSMQGDEVNGELVRWLPQECLDVAHFALVQAGADPMAGPRLSNEKQNNRNTSDIGDEVMTNDKLNSAVTLLSTICEALKIDGFDAENVSDEFEAKVREQIESVQSNLESVTAQLATLTDKIEGLKSFIDPEAKDITTGDILAKLPEVLGYAQYGKTFLQALKEEALKCFDTAKCDAENKELSDSAKEIRKVIENTTSINALKAYIEEYKPQADSRLGKVDHRSSKGEELPVEKPTATDVTQIEMNIRESVQRLYRKDQK